jgi:uncharacterized protein YhdP
LPGQDLVLTGLDGQLDYRDNKAMLELASTGVSFKAADLFRYPLVIDRLTGRLSVNRKGDGFVLSSDAVYASNADIETVSRLKIDVPASGQPFLDVQTSYRNAVAASAYKYAPAGIMAEGLVEWIDKAFSDGIVKQGGFLLRGCGADFPFRENQGVMQALFEVEGASLHFMDNWPEMHNLSATVNFHNTTVEVTHGRGWEKDDVKVQANARIPDVEQALLFVDADIAAAADDLQQYVWNSPLDALLGNALKQFQATGPTRTQLSLEVPIAEQESRLQLDGKLRFEDNEVFFEQMDYTLNQLNGELAFSLDSVSGSGLSARFDGQPVDIDVVTTRGDLPETVFNVHGRWKAGSLLRAIPDHPFDFVKGRSDFSVKVKVPHRQTDYDVLIDMRSSLKGISIELSDRIHKNTASASPVSASLKFYRDARSLQVVSENVIDLNATVDDSGFWNFVVDSPVVKGRGRIREDLDIGSVVKLELERLVLSAFIRENSAGKTVSGIKAADIPSLDITVDELHWKQATLKNIRLATERHPRGMVFNEFTIDDPFLRVTGKGSWLRHSWHFREETSISLKLSSPDAGGMLQRMGYSRYVDQSVFSASIDWNWPGEPYAFSWDAINGKTSVTFANGVIRDIDPGAGRLLGLFNVLHLPKRLGLNFEELYEKGFVFDSITGDYVFADGEAVTQNTEIKASAADMLMMGSIGVDDQDYDLVTIVSPHTTAATFAGGTLAAGPTVGLGLVLLQELLGIEFMGRDVYTVKGSWNQPTITRISTGGDSPVDDFEE